jgi:MoxR-like ATPase
MTKTLQMPQCWQDVHDVIDAGAKQIILYGPPGTGKTYAGLNIGDVSNGAWRLVCTDEMTAADVVGHWMPAADGAWTWNDGAVIKAWQGNGLTGGRVVADEIDKANGDVLGMLLAMFDSHQSASWQNPDTGRTVRPHDGFSVVMTTNIENMDELPEALKDRFPVAIRINTPHPKALEVLSEDLRKAAAQSADADKSRRFSVRTFMEFDKLRGPLGDERAARIVFANRAEDILDAIAINKVAS